MRELQFEKQELLKALSEARTKIRDLEKTEKILIEKFGNLERQLSDMEMTAAEENERATLAASRVDDLKDQVEYLKGQVLIYQNRLGLLPQERQAPTGEKPQPLRRSREPFAVAAAKVQAQRTEEYWKARAAAAGEGITGSTTQATPTVSQEVSVGEPSSEVS